MKGKTFATTNLPKTTFHRMTLERPKMTEEEAIKRINALTKRVKDLERAIQTALITTGVFLGGHVSPTVSLIDKTLRTALKEEP